MIATQSRTLQAWREAPIPGDATMLQLCVSVTFGFFTELAPARFSRLLDQIADCEHFHDITMVD